MDAECIVSSSFHGTTFSILFNRPFYSVRLNDGADSRTEYLLKSLELSDRFISLESRVDFSVVDFKVANHNLADLIKESDDYLDQFLNY